jgi:DNA-directed RNA polymerase specialized sigma24 family protein
MKTQWYKRTEAKLYAYPSIDTAIAHLEAQYALLDANIIPPKGAVYDRIGPPTTADRLTEPEQYAGTRIEKMDRIKLKIALKRAEKVAIEAALGRLAPEEKRLVETWYFKDWKHTKLGKSIWRELTICRTEFYSRKRETLEKVAEYLGEKALSI